jgi:hypothetical protein
MGEGTIGYITIQTNTVHDNGWNAVNDGYTPHNAGIKVWGGANTNAAGQSNNVTIEYNEVYNQLDQFGDYSGTGIWLDQWGSNGIIRYNKVHNNGAYAIIVENPQADSAIGPQVYYNLVYSNNKGISVNRDASNCKVYNNVSYGNTLNGLMCEGVGSQTAMIGNLFKNNISFGNDGVQLSCILGGANTGGGSGNVYLNNCLGVPSASHFVEWVASTYKDTVSVFDTAYGSASATVGASPIVVNTSTPDFHLQPNSPCIKAGVSVGLTQDYAGKPVGPLPSVGAYEPGHSLILP